MKKFFSFLLAICFLVPLALVLTACGNDAPETRYAWGKTFSYQGTVMHNFYSYGGNNGTEKGQLVKSEFKKSNLDLTKVKINNVTTDLSACANLSADQFLQEITKRAKAEMQSLYGNITIKVGTEEECNVTINGKVYKLQKTEFDHRYNIIDESESETSLNRECGNLSVKLCHDGNNQDLNYGLDISKYTLDGKAGVVISSVTIEIPTIKVIEDESALFNGTYSYITISYTPYFNEVV